MKIIACENYEVLSRLFSGKITTKCPATVWNMHRDVTLICDKAAYEG